MKAWRKMLQRGKRTKWRRYFSAWRKCMCYSLAAWTDAERSSKNVGDYDKIIAMQIREPLGLKLWIAWAWKYCWCNDSVLEKWGSFRHSVPITSFRPSSPELTNHMPQNAKPHQGQHHHGPSLRRIKNDLWYYQDALKSRDTQCSSVPVFQMPVPLGTASSV